MKIEIRIVLFVIGVFLGFWGSTASYLAWFLAPWIGFVLAESISEMPEHHLFRKTPVLITALLICVGIFFGGVPIWAIAIKRTTVEKFHWISMAQLFITAIMFFIGAMCNVIISYLKNNATVQYLMHGGRGLFIRKLKWRNQSS